MISISKKEKISACEAWAIMPAVIVLLVLLSCNNNNSGKPAAQQQKVSLHPLINVADNTAAQYKNNNWYLWCSTYSTFYDSLLNIESDSDTLLFKQPLLDSIIKYKQFYTDSTLPLLRNAYYNRGFDLDDEGQYYLARDDFENVLRLGASIGFDKFHQEFISLNRLANILNMLGDVRQSILVRQRQIERCKKEGTDDQLATAYLNLSILYNDVGQSDTAITILEQALQLENASGWSLGKLLSTLGSIQAPTDTTKAYTNSVYALLLLSN